ncbi:uncharacterized [Tachysurus ichikawai]
MDREFSKSSSLINRQCQGGVCGNKGGSADLGREKRPAAWRSVGPAELATAARRFCAYMYTLLQAQKQSTGMSGNLKPAQTYRLSGSAQSRPSLNANNPTRERGCKVTVMTAHASFASISERGLVRDAQPDRSC